MEDRYEIRGKIGQGGLGSVYRAYDTRMKREVAIKRISSGNEDKELQEESTRQLIKEAGALASLQHPHIVTVYDVGSDEDGPFVVMELITGKTLDELVERAPLTWPDFRELAMQSQEALIAAQELELVHRDIKPGNVMLNWLPSGKFQVKIVDFGLAKMTPKPSLQTLDQSDSVFGSIYFMAPEQFERKPLDFRTDMYAMGCVYYHALTGVYPFDGETGAQVMASHLQHNVAPIQEVRPEIPLWVCDWIMWHLNRFPDDRPASARESLHVFLQNDPIPNPPFSTGKPPPAPEPVKRARLIIPGVAEAEPEPVPAEPAGPVAVMKGIPAPLIPTAPVKTQTSSQATIRGNGGQPGTHTAPQNLHQTAAYAPAAIPVPTGPLPAASTGSTLPTTRLARGPAATGPVPGFFTSSHGTRPTILKKKKPANNAAKMTVAAILGILAILITIFLINRSDENRQIAIYNAQLAEAAKGDATEVLVNSKSLDFMLESAANVGANTERQTIYKALFLARATDGTNVDARIAEFATTRPMVPDIREVLIRDVLRKRQNPEIVPALMKFASTTDDIRAATAALQAARFMVGDAELDEFIKVIQFTPHQSVRQAAEEAVAEIIRKSNNRRQIAETLAATYEGSVDDNVRLSLLRLLGRTGGERAMALVKASLADPEVKNKTAAIVALGAWGDDEGFPVLMEFLASTNDDSLRARAFDAAHRYVSSMDDTVDPAVHEKLWIELAANATTTAEQIKTLQGLATRPFPWSVKLVENFLENSKSDPVEDLAEKVLRSLREVVKTPESDGETPQ